MTRAILIRMTLAVLAVTAGCRSERALTEQRRQVPLASPGEIARFSLVAPNLGVLPPGGHCDTLARSLDQLATVKGQLVSFGSASAGRRITVGVDDANRIVYYDDTHTGPNAEWVLVDRRYDEGMAVSMHADARPRRVHGHAEEVLQAPGLGSPAQVARRVLNACSAMLATTK